MYGRLSVRETVCIVQTVTEAGAKNNLVYVCMSYCVIYVCLMHCGRTRASSKLAVLTSIGSCTGYCGASRTDSD